MFLNGAKLASIKIICDCNSDCRHKLIMDAVTKINKESDIMNIVSTKNECNHSAELEFIVGALRAELENFVKANIENIWKEIDENIKPRVNELWDMSGKGLFDLEHLVKHCQDGIGKCFEQIDGIKESFTANTHHVSNLFQGTRAKLDMLLGNFDSLKERVVKLEEAYDADSEVAKDILFEGARQNEEIRQIKSECDLHCDAILVLERWKDELTRDNGIYAEPMQQRVWQENIITRLEKLEQLAQERAHLINYKSYTDLSDRLERLESRYESFAFFHRDNRQDLNDSLRAIQDEYKQEFANINERIDTYHKLVLGACPIDIEKEIRNNMDKTDTEMSKQYPQPFKAMKPHKCPVCDGKGERITKGCSTVAEFIENCYSCKATGIVWA
jgi:hypothetical protein